MFGIKRANCIYGNYFEIWQGCQIDDCDVLDVFETRQQAERFCWDNNLTIGYDPEGIPEKIEE